MSDREDVPKAHKKALGVPKARKKTLGVPKQALKVGDEVTISCLTSTDLVPSLTGHIGCIEEWAAYKSRWRVNASTRHTCFGRDFNVMPANLIKCKASRNC